MSRFRQPVRITRKTSFCASHRYHNPSWSDERNREVFGARNNPHGHGHDYELEVTVEGDVDPETGMVLNLREVDRVLEEEVVSVLDHRYINREVPGFDVRMPTSENLVVWIWERLEDRLARPNARLHRVRLRTTRDLYVDYFGESASASEQEMR